MSTRKFSQKQIRYLWAVGYFRSSPNYRGKTVTAQKVRKSTGGNYSRDFDTANDQLDKELTSRDSPMYIAIGSTKLQLVHNPESSPRFRIGTIDTNGEEIALRFFRDEIEEDGIKEIPKKEFEVARPKSRDYNPNLSEKITDVDRAEIVDEFKTSHPDVRLDFETPDPRGTLQHFGAESLGDILDSFTGGQLDIFKDYDISMYVGSGKSAGFVASNLMHNVQIAMTPKAGITSQSQQVEIYRSYDMDNKVAYHESLQIPKSMQGQGIGKKIYDANVDQAKKMGMKEMSLVANCDVGGYMWAKMGFEPSKGYEDKFRETLLTRYTMLEESREASPAELDKTLDFLKTNPSARQVAEFRVGSEKTGAKLLLGSMWRGTKKL